MMRHATLVAVSCLLASCGKSAVEQAQDQLRAQPPPPEPEWVLWIAQTDIQKGREPVFYPDTVFQDEASCNSVADAMVKSGDPNATPGTRTVIQGAAGAYFSTKYSCLPRWLDPRPPR